MPRNRNRDPFTVRSRAIEHAFPMRRELSETISRRWQTRRGGSLVFASWRNL
jgi:hypothetical protein